MILPKILDTHTGVHENKVRELFHDKQSHFDGDAPEFETPLILLGFFNRSGSNLLGNHLRDLPDFSGFKEELNHPAIKSIIKRKNLNSFPDYFRSAQNEYPRDHCYGYKASWNQVLMLNRCGIDRMYKGVKLIHITRGDLIGQAISLVIAMQTLKWTSEQTGKDNVEPQYDSNQISSAIEACCKAEMQMKLVSEITNLDRLHVFYEDLVAEPEKVMQRVGLFLGRDLSDWQPGKVAIKRQASELNDQWRKRYLSDALGKLGVEAFNQDE
jgi:trehalose 2-sulfotransferase